MDRPVARRHRPHVWVQPGRLLPGGAHQTSPAGGPNTRPACRMAGTTVGRPSGAQAQHRGSETMTLLRDVISIPETAGAEDYVLRLTEGVGHGRVEATM